jgi:hypothetical protein
MKLPDVNLDAISDLATREVVRQLLNIIEALAAENVALRAKNQQLRDENARLKGGLGQPDSKPLVFPTTTNHFSKSERQTRTLGGKPKKNATLMMTREEQCVVAPRPYHQARASTARARPSCKTSSSGSRSSASCVGGNSFRQPTKPFWRRYRPATMVALLSRSRPSFQCWATTPPM